MPDPHSQRMKRALLSLDGLSVGDAFGQCFFAAHEIVTQARIANDDPPPPPWHYTDDTEMACGIIEVLERHGRIDQDDLANTFARRYTADGQRGYGGTAHRILRTVAAGRPWREISREVFDGMGSMGNGAAMRVAPLGAYFADDIPTLVEQARLSAEVTHAHPEGQAGAVAVALAAAFAWNHRGQRSPKLIREFMEFVLDGTPDSRTRAGIAQAIDLPRSYAVETAASVLGNGTGVSSPDTVPFAIWCAARCFGRFTEALWTTVSGGGDRDTTCAIIGGIVVLSASDGAIPPNWLAAREAPPLR